MLNFLMVFAFFIPVLSSLVCAIFSKITHKIFVQIFSLSTVIFLTCVSLYAFFTFESSYIIKLMPWIYLGGMQVDWAINVDKLTLTMFVVVSIVSLVVRIYSFEYMRDDTGKLRFFSYLSFFAFAMLLLVASSNFLQLFLGWEAVGLCSYLLIGFWFQKKSANDAAIKAFIVNRVGDVFLIIGISAIYSVFDTLNFVQIFSQVSMHQDTKILGFNAISFICFTLFLGCMGKSAQLGLHVWLPDAMEGPTPVSALIHAATMVTAGVFLVVRASPLFQFALFVNEFIMVIGAITAIFAASIALFTDDIKKIIAYSTCSQLGYMFIACGAGAYNIAMFHLVTHAFFKALLFLSAGSVIHAMHGVQDIHKMECNLWKKIPITYSMFWIGSLALAGIFPFAGFYSKDLIIESVYNMDFVFAIALVVTILTAMYSWRLIIVVFHTKEKMAVSSSAVVHESSFVMLLPLCVLALLSIVSGFYLEDFLHIVSSGFWGDSLVIKTFPEIPFTKKILPLICALSGVICIFILRPLFLLDGYVLKKGYFIGLGIFFLLLLFVINMYLLPIAFILIAVFMKDRNMILINIIKNKYYIDEIYDKFIVLPLQKLSIYLWTVFDVKKIDSVPNCLAAISQQLSQKLLKSHSGYIYDSAFIIFLGIMTSLLVVTIGYLIG